MWEQIIELLLGKALERLKDRNTPRNRMARAFAAVFVSLQKCHAEWERCLTRNCREEWLGYVNELATRIDGLRVLLEIHQPELLKILDDYGRSEARVSKYIGKMPETELTSLAIKEAFSPAMLSEVDGEFELAMEKLRKFMRDELKLTPEELFNL